MLAKRSTNFWDLYFAPVQLPEYKEEDYNGDAKIMKDNWKELIEIGLLSACKFWRYEKWLKGNKKGQKLA